MEFIINQTDEVLVSHSGLALTGAMLKRSPLRKRLNEICLGKGKRPEVPHGDVLSAMIGLLCLGKSDYADIEAYRQEEFFRRAMGLNKVPSEETLRQRMDQLGTTAIDMLHEESAGLIARHAPALTACHRDWIPLDIDVSPFDNSGTKKEGVAWTYKKLHGYAPNFAYLGEEAQALGEWEEPRPGKEIYTGETWRTRDGKRYRVVFEVIYRTIAADGQRLLLPEIEISTWWTSLRLSPKKVIELYHQHGTSEQFHSELKSDMDLERLPSGKFATNALMLSLSPGGLQPASSVRPNGVGRE